jgi:hypothetical protein
MLSTSVTSQADHVGVAALAFDLRAQVLQLLDAAAGQHDRRAGARQRAGELRAQAAGGAGDEGDAAGKVDAVAHGTPALRCGMRGMGWTVADCAGPAA